MLIRKPLLATAILIAGSALASAQGTIPDAAQGAREGDRAAGPVGAVVGGATGAAVGTVGGVAGVPADRGCESKTVHSEDGAGNSETVHRSNCP